MFICCSKFYLFFLLLFNLREYNAISFWAAYQILSQCETDF